MDEPTRGRDPRDGHTGGRTIRYGGQRSWTLILCKNLKYTERLTLKTPAQPY